ncbi:YbfB/YjiJ family MFS transporter [Brevibacillus ginsengisoli]|uniref:YbfB/YjiJ family MFS transporter n=1 Tax=Brevibacillus ginsengisoli TaxID=363854 RepID=UPI003CE679B6
MEQKPMIPLIGGIAALIVAMGIGRFSFTPILPMMMDKQLFSTVGAGYLASSNYLGYLLGALVLTVIPLKRRSRLLIAGMIMSIVTTWGMGAVTGFAGWLVLRFMSGVASSIVFVVASSIVLERLSGVWTGIFYGGVGVGILLTGVVVPLFADYGQWMGAWKGLGLLSLVLGLLACYLLAERQGIEKPSTNFHVKRPESVQRILLSLMIAYGLEGLGYIVTGTYLVAYAKISVNIENITSLSWMLVGLAAAPSCILWSLLAARWGKKWTLTLTMILQSIGIAIPVIAPSSATLLLGAVLFGATFMGITTLTISYAKDLYPLNNRRIIGLLTTIYGLGQMIGPVIAGVLISGRGSYDAALIGASLIVLLGAVILPLGIGRSDQMIVKPIG